ncbi:Hsp20 family protein [Selenomonas sp.]|uniref:Hsp20 family protein n=1 Tax=Selenomonas sp. TaxID=2053611 RepID=UPI003FA303FF
MIRSIPFNFRNNAEKTRDTVERVVDFIMEQPLNPIGKVTGALASFRCDILDEENYYAIEAELPGIFKEDVSLTYEDDKYLTIAAEAPEREARLKYVLRERRTGRFERSFVVDGIKWDESTASMENGVLKVILPKLGAEDVKKNSIEIK